MVSLYEEICFDSPEAVEDGPEEDKRNKRRNFSLAISNLEKCANAVGIMVNVQAIAVKTCHLGEISVARATFNTHGTWKSLDSLFKQFQGVREPTDLRYWINHGPGKIKVNDTPTTILIPPAVERPLIKVYGWKDHYYLRRTAALKKLQARSNQQRSVTNQVLNQPVPCSLIRRTETPDDEEDPMLCSADMLPLQHDNLLELARMDSSNLNLSNETIDGREASSSLSLDQEGFDEQEQLYSVEKAFLMDVLDTMPDFGKERADGIHIDFTKRELEEFCAKYNVEVRYGQN